MTFKEACEAMKPEKITVDIMKLNYLSDEDIKVCNYVISQLPYIEIESIEEGRLISLDELIEMSLEEIKIFGDDISLKIRNLLLNVPIDRHNQGLFDFFTQITYSVDDESYAIDYNSGMVSSYLIPQYLFESSVFHFSHEHIHALKETNYEEYVNGLVLGETIPMFYELITYNSDEVLKKGVLRLRLRHLLNNKDDYLIVNALAKSDCVLDRSLYEYVRTKVGCYLNSFYYALILYSMYKETPKKILDLISRVLKHEMTTLQLLEHLDIYGDIRGRVFERELSNIKKLVK